MGLEGWGRQIYLRLDDLRFSNEFFDLRFTIFQYFIRRSSIVHSIVTLRSSNRKYICFTCRSSISTS